MNTCKSTYLLNYPTEHSILLPTHLTHVPYVYMTHTHACTHAHTHTHHTHTRLHYVHTYVRKCLGICLVSQFLSQIAQHKHNAVDHVTNNITCQGIDSCIVQSGQENNGEEAGWVGVTLIVLTHA